MVDLKLLILTPTFLPKKGGIEEAVFNLSKELSQNYNIEVFIVTPFIDKKSRRFEKYNNVTIYRFCRLLSIINNKASKFFLYNICGFFYILYLSFFKRIKFGIINTHSVALLGIASVLISKIFKKTLIFTIHHYGSGSDISHPEDNGFLVNKLIKKLLEFSDYIIVTSKSQEDYLKYLFEKKINKIKYSKIPLAASIKNLSENPKRQDKKDIFNDKFIIFSVGRLVKRKRYDILLEIAKLLKHNNKIIFIIAGDGPEKKNLIKEIKKKNLQNVILLGEISDDEKTYWLAKSNLFIQCSEYEGFGITYIEALSFGLPVLAYRNEAIEEIQEKINDGIFIFDNIKSAVKKILYLKKNKNSINKKKEIINKTKKYYSWKNTAKKYYDIFTMYKN